mgnify:CR=1 FL=1|jgi:hypothetical protein
MSWIRIMDPSYVAWWRQEVENNNKKEKNSINIPKKRKDA